MNFVEKHFGSLMIGGVGVAMISLLLFGIWLQNNDEEYQELLGNKKPVISQTSEQLEQLEPQIIPEPIPEPTPKNKYRNVTPKKKYRNVYFGRRMWFRQEIEE